MIVVERAGFACVQDLGRATRYAPAGVPPGGAFDEWALRAANALAGNDDDAAALEIVLRGPRLRFEHAAICAIAGSPCDASVNGSPVSVGEAFVVPPGGVLDIGTTSGGARSIIAVLGGVATPRVLGSRSVSPRAGIGAMLRDGETLPVGGDGPITAPDALPRLRAPLPRPDRIRVIAGPNDDRFAEGALDALCDVTYRVTADADRSGVRLDGPPLGLAAAGEMDPEPAVPGCVQVPADGRPIVLGPDGPVTGGYPRIATVIAADLWVVGQARPGDTIRFERVTVERARLALGEARRWLRDAIER